MIPRGLIAFCVWTGFWSASFAAAQAAPEAAPVFHVAPDGNDAWSGRLARPNEGKTDGPFATLPRARDAVRQMRSAAATRPTTMPVVVNVTGGVYTLSRGIQLTAADSGSPLSPVVYQAVAGQTVKLRGGVRVTGWKPVADKAIRERLRSNARGHVLQADLKALGVTNFGQFKSRGFARNSAPATLELFFQDAPMTLARWPNQGFVKIASIPADQATGDSHGGTLGKLEGGFHYEGDRPKEWKEPQGAWVHGYWAWDWANSYEQIASIDLKTRLIKTAAPHGVYGFRAGQRFFFLNILEELDEPGEWYLDRASGMLYFWPPASIDAGEAMVSCLEEPLIYLNGASYVTLRGFTLECGRGHGIEVNDGRGDLIADCTLRNLGNYGITAYGGFDHSISGCEISNTGDGGIRLEGGDRKTLAPANLLAINNHIHHVARWSKCYVPAIMAHGVGIRIANNLIHDHPHCAILFGGNEHIIELNEIHRVCLETGDVGAIYTGRDYSYRGNIIRHNYIHHTGGVGMGSMGVYMDDCVSGTLIQGNVFHKVQRAVFLGGGRDFRVENNLFVDCAPAVAMDGRGMDKSPVWHNMVFDYMKKRLEEVDWTKPPYRTRYPQLVDLEKYYQKTDGIPPENNVLLRNVSVGGKWLEVGWHASPAMLQVKDNLVDTDPGFVDRAAGNFQLRDDSPAYKLGFQRIPMEQIGPRKAR